MQVLRNKSELRLDPSKPHHVWIPYQGSVFSPKGQAFNQALCEWFLRTGNDDEDLEAIASDYVLLVEEDEFIRKPPQPNFMVFGFDDPKRAALFKLAWG